MRRVVRILIVSTLAGAATTATSAALATVAHSGSQVALAAWNADRGLLIEGATVVTMDEHHSVIPHGSVLVRAGRIVAVWSGPQTPAGVEVGDASVIHEGPQDLLYPGLINLHSHPDDNVLPTWLAPSADAIPQQGKGGTDPYANRYQWSGSSATSSVELQRLVVNPRGVLEDDLGLGLHGDVVKYAEVASLLGGETAIQGASPDPRSDGILIRNIDNNAFDTRIAPPRIGSIGEFAGADLTALQNGLRDGQYDAWMVHLAEGVRDADRRPGDPVSSRAEFQTLKSLGLLTDQTVIIHGTALERADFAQMRAAPTARADGVRDGLGAKLIWSPLSNLLLYGETTNVYDAIAEGVLVSLGTDWTPSGSRTLLHELKIADVALRDPRLLGVSQAEVPALAIDGKTGTGRQLADEALDRALVDMVTRNPAITLHWYDKVGSIETGKYADMMLIHRPSAPALPGRPPSVYRDLINATERDVDLVLVGGEPLAGATATMSVLKPGDYEVVTSDAGGFQKAVDVTTTAAVPDGDETLAQITANLQAGLTALGGDDPPAGGGPGPATNTYSYLKAHVAGGAAANLPDPVFRQLLAANVGLLPNGSLNLEKMRLEPLFEADDDLLNQLLRGHIDPTTGLLADPDPPYRLYPANLNQIGPLGNPFQDVPL
jgi:cytosine/adenosine deaminase-related metal-dependent hydrolase